MLYPQAPPTSGAIFYSQIFIRRIVIPKARVLAGGPRDLARSDTGLATLSFRPSRSVSDGVWRNLLLHDRLVGRKSLPTFSMANLEGNHYDVYAAPRGKR